MREGLIWNRENESGEPKNLREIIKRVPRILILAINTPEEVGSGSLGIFRVAFRSWKKFRSRLPSQSSVCEVNRESARRRNLAIKQSIQLTVQLTEMITCRGFFRSLRHSLYEDDDFIYSVFLLHARRDSQSCDPNAARFPKKHAGAIRVRL